MICQDRLRTDISRYLICLTLHVERFGWERAEEAVLCRAAAAVVKVANRAEQRRAALVIAAHLVAEGPCLLVAEQIEIDKNRPLIEQFRWSGNEWWFAKTGSGLNMRNI
jgi:hypothetical protein